MVLENVQIFDEDLDSASLARYMASRSDRHRYGNNGVGLGTRSPVFGTAVRFSGLCLCDRNC